MTDTPIHIYQLNSRHQKFCLIGGILCLILLPLFLFGIAFLFLRSRAKVVIYTDRLEYTWFGTTVYYWNDIERISSNVPYTGRGSGGILNHYLSHGRPLLMIQRKSTPTPLMFAIRFYENYDELVREIERRAKLKIS